MILDHDSQDNLKAGEELLNMTHSDGWGIARAMLTEKIIDLQNIHNVDESSIDNVVVDIKSRKAAVAILYEWLKNVEGRVEQHEANKRLLENPKDPNDFVNRE